jgi:RNA polymerase sigma factor (sigma-70 family)
MDINDTANSLNSPQILPFQVKKCSPQASIYTDDKENRLFDIKYRSFITSCCLAVLRNEADAQEITNTVFQKIFELKAKGVFIPETKYYISTMAKNMSISRLRRARKEMLLLRQKAADERISFFISKGDDEQKIWEAGLLDNGYEQIEAEIIIKSVLAEQDETTRKIYRYKYIEDMTLEQIGEILGLVKSAVHKRIKKLEKQLKAAWNMGEK